jgi:predicted  nucleic acid-binding Zn-ribbon protein
MTETDFEEIYQKCNTPIINVNDWAKMLLLALREITDELQIIETFYRNELFIRLDEAMGARYEKTDLDEELETLISKVSQRYDRIYRVEKLLARYHATLNGVFEQSKFNALKREIETINDSAKYLTEIKNDFEKSTVSDIVDNDNYKKLFKNELQKLESAAKTTNDMLNHYNATVSVEFRLPKLIV